MLLWTIVPPDSIFPAENFNPVYNETRYHGIPMLVERVSPQQCQIVRLLSTDPQDYLRQDLQPGQLIDFQQLPAN